jgi:hypothetical protein
VIAGELLLGPPWGGPWPDDGQAREVPTPAPGPHWKVLRARLERLGLDFDPNLHDELGLVGYTLRLRNTQLGIGAVQRPSGLHLALTAVLCRGMEREGLAVAAIDRANRDLRMGQILFYPGPPPELSYYISVPWKLVDDALFTPLLAALLREIEDVGFAAVTLVRGVHPSDIPELWQQLESVLAGLMAEQSAADPQNSSSEAAPGAAGDQPPKEAAPPETPATPPRKAVRIKRKPKSQPH